MPGEGGCRAGRRHGRVGLRGRATDTVPGPLFDLVSMQYPALPNAAGEAVVRSCSTRCALAGCCWPCTTTSTTSNASTHRHSSAGAPALNRDEALDQIPL